MSAQGIKRLYYSISEVSRLVDEEQYVLRYWETEFEQLRPQKNRAGNRIYTDKDIELIKAIKYLLRTKRYTIEGAKDSLQQYQANESSGTSSLHTDNTPTAVKPEIQKPDAQKTDTQRVDTHKPAGQTNSLYTAQTSSKRTSSLPPSVVPRSTQSRMITPPVMRTDAPEHIRFAVTELPHHSAALTNTMFPRLHAHDFLALKRPVAYEKSYSAPHVIVPAVQPSAQEFSREVLLELKDVLQELLKSL